MFKIYTKELTYATRTENGGFGGDQKCIYCGKKAKRIEVPKNGSKWPDEYYFCDCEDAQKEHEINLKIVELANKRPEPKYRITAVLMGSENPIVESE